MPLTRICVPSGDHAACCVPVVMGGPVSIVGARPSTQATANGRVLSSGCPSGPVHGGRCADANHVLNGAKGRADAAPFLIDDHTHLNQAGHQAIADALTALGFDPLP